MSSQENSQPEELPNAVEPSDKLQLVKSKRGRKKKVKPEGDIIFMDAENKEGDEVKEISHTKARQILKEKKPYKPSEKQMENAKRLVELNKKRREEKHKKEAEEKEAEEKAKALQEAKKKKIKYVVRPKGESKRGRKIKEVVPQEDSTDDGETSGGETTDTRTIKKKLKHIEAISSKIDEVKKNPYVSLLQKSGF